MQTRPFGSSGPQVSVLGYGAMQLGDPALDEAHVARMLHRVARRRGIGRIAKRSLAGRPWATGDDTPHAEYRRRYECMRRSWAVPIPDWDEFSLRFATYVPGVDCVIVGGTDPANVDRNVAAVARGALMMEEQAAITTAFESHRSAWQGLV